MYSNPSLLFKKYGNIAKKTNKQTFVNTVLDFQCLLYVKLVPDKLDISKG